MSRNLYRLLGIQKGATATEVKAAYRKLSKRAHADAGGSDAAFVELKQARDVLMDPDRRAHYDATGQIKPDDPDQGRGPVIALLGGILIKVVGMASAQNVNIKTEDMILAIVAVIDKSIAELKERKAAIAASAEMFKTVAERMEVDGGEDNILKGIAEAQLGSIAIEVARIDPIIAAHEAARKLAKSHRFRQDIVKQNVSQLYAAYMQHQASGTTTSGWR